MSKHGPRPGVLHISGTGMPTSTRVDLDGIDISRCLYGLFLRMTADELPTAVLSVFPRDVETEVEIANVTVSEETQKLLVQLGWTPPAEEST